MWVCEKKITELDVGAVLNREAKTLGLIEVRSRHRVDEKLWDTLISER
jgi:hypothetical protein